jgi:hypothetical protein
MPKGQKGCCRESKGMQRSATNIKTIITGMYEYVPVTAGTKRYAGINRLSGRLSHLDNKILRVN